uniref:Exoribonuclease phosphorolytic domain-containing protein n=1 Tax=Aplanochytrium stocchinoi TaxID=215587 RepID=A0A7S3V1W3_9STRA|mmetsp:Transcript_9732/g.12154  ORF Transcript_9732/g.12154 Transcript_9732/m.12154 type:complete len:244 (+) Transcript_9732:256-987(+)|eukprot:CAMPEP_0204829140 /NCGR_PEP_ID=MMETSP1346-20131115/7188_1 /ASSEMBLY_ACC=CAM_ASM_000771 /TAXON_ID=215587 /ORGANISM="Aplanochytrium stocchinoi, Strain GSBS06" /LENGTH=243 /DNA_ID=CAMNT_0051958695 /DNA_START=192 /DNA_END=923 /DNA_ORIENTATION=+
MAYFPESKGQERLNDRAHDELRELSMETGLLSQSDGSCQFSFQNTCVLASVHGPMEPKSSRKELIDRACIEVYLKPAQGQQGSEERDYEVLIRGILEEVSQTQSFPRTVITISLQVINADGSLLPCAVMAAACALIDAGIPLFAIPSACCCAISQEGQPLLDQDAEEEDQSRATVFVCTKTDEGNSKASSVLSILSDGAITREELNSCLLLCMRGCSAARAFVTLSLKETEKSRLTLTKSDLE